MQSSFTGLNVHMQLVKISHMICGYDMIPNKTYLVRKMDAHKNNTGWTNNQRPQVLSRAKAERQGKQHNRLGQWESGDDETVGKMFFIITVMLMNENQEKRFPS